MEERVVSDNTGIGVRLLVMICSGSGLGRLVMEMNLVGRIIVIVVKRPKERNSTTRTRMVHVDNNNNSSSNKGRGVFDPFHLTKCRSGWVYEWFVVTPAAAAVVVVVYHHPFRCRELLGWVMVG